MIPGWGVYQDPRWQESDALTAQVSKLLAANDFAGLENLASELRRSHARFSSGSWKLTGFYENLEPVESGTPELWKKAMATFERWRLDRPNSITAQVAGANALVRYAWRARGSGFADSITPEGGSLFSARLAEAWKVLGNARTLEEKDPHWWVVAQQVARGEGWDRPRYDRLCAEAVAFEPQYFEFDVERAIHLLPRWMGKSGEWERSADEAAQRKGGLGAEVYARVVFGLMSWHRNVFQESDASWEKSKEGLHLMQERYPGSTFGLIAQTKLAQRADDRTSAREALAALGERIDSRFFDDSRDFLLLRSWAGFALEPGTGKIIYPPGAQYLPGR